MEKEKLLKQAKFLYPVGTKFEVKHIKVICTVRSHEEYRDTFVTNSSLYINFYIEEVAYNCDGAAVYNSKTGFSKVISRPDEYIKLTSNSCTCTTHSEGKKYSKFKSGAMFIEDKTYKVIDRIAKDCQFLLVISNLDQVYIINADSPHVVNANVSTKEQFDEDWNKTEDNVNNYYDYNIADIPPAPKIKQKPMEKKEDLIVHVPYIEMYNFVKDNSNIDFDNYDVYGEETCLMPNNCSYSEKKWFEDENYKITSFTDWLKQTNNKVKWKDYLLELAKKKYPIGCTISSLSRNFKEEINDHQYPHCLTADLGDQVLWLRGKKYYNLKVYEDGKWAEATEPVVKCIEMDYKELAEDGVKLCNDDIVLGYGGGGEDSMAFYKMFNNAMIDPITSNKGSISHIDGNLFSVDELITKKNKLSKREYYIPKKEVKEVKQLVQYIPRERSKSINKY